MSGGVGADISRRSFQIRSDRTCAYRRTLNAAQHYLRSRWRFASSYAVRNRAVSLDSERASAIESSSTIGCRDIRFAGKAESTPCPAILSIREQATQQRTQSSQRWGIERRCPATREVLEVLVDDRRAFEVVIRKLGHRTRPYDVTHPVAPLCRAGGRGRAGLGLRPMRGELLLSGPSSAVR